MNWLLWILSVSLAAVYALTGIAKLVAPRDGLLAVPGMGWVEETPISRVRLIGLLEVAGAIGVVVPWASGIWPVLTPLAASGLAAVQVGAMWTHIGRDETEHLWLNVLLLLAAVAVAIGRVVA